MDMLTDTATWQMQRILASGATYEKVIQEIALISGKSEQALTQAFQQAGIQTLKFDDSIYKAAGLSPTPFNLDPSMLNVLKAGLVKTNGVIRNLTLTTAATSRNAFIDSLDLAYMQVSSGALDYNTAIRRAVKDLARNGVTIIGYSSRKDQVDVAVRRALLTGVGQTASQLQDMRADQMGADLVQTSAHAGARPSHQKWQGKVFSRSGTDKKYPDFKSVTGYGTVGGLNGANCRHSWYPFFKGISKNAYEDATVNELNDKTVKFGDTTLPMYDALQYQRSIEREIRAVKREAGALDAAGLENVNELNKIKELQARLRAFTKQTGLPRQSVREGGKFAFKKSTKTTPVTTSSDKQLTIRQDPRR